MGNFFKSLALAATLASSDAQSAAPNQWGDTLALKNERAKAVLAALESVKAGTPAGKSTAAVDSVIPLAKDGEITSEDAAAIAAFWSKIHRAGNPVGPDWKPIWEQNLFRLNDKLKALAEALTIKDAVELPTAKPETNANGVAWEGADAQNNNQDVQVQELKPKSPLVNKSENLPSLSESKAEKEARKERERLEKLLEETLTTLNRWWFFKKEGWSSNDGKWAKAKSKHSRDSITVEFDPGTVKKGVAETAAKSTSAFKVTLLPGKSYRWTFGKVSEKATILIKDKDLNGRFNTLTSGMTAWANVFQIPNGHDGSIEVEVVNSAMVPLTTIEGAKLEVMTDEEARLAGL